MERIINGSNQLRIHSKMYKIQKRLNVIGIFYCTNESCYKLYITLLHEYFDGKNDISI